MVDILVSELRRWADKVERILESDRQIANLLYKAADRVERAEARAERAEDRVRAWDDGRDPPPLEEDSAVGKPDILELIGSAPRFTGDRAGGPVAVTLDPSECVATRSEFVAYGRALEWQRRRIAELEDRVRASLDLVEKAAAVAQSSSKCVVAYRELLKQEGLS